MLVRLANLATPVARTPESGMALDETVCIDDLKEQVQCLFLRAGAARNIERLIDGCISSRMDGDRLQVWVRVTGVRKKMNN